MPYDDIIYILYCFFIGIAQVLDDSTRHSARIEFHHMPCRAVSRIYRELLSNGASRLRPGSVSYARP